MLNEEATHQMCSLTTLPSIIVVTVFCSQSFNQHCQCCSRKRTKSTPMVDRWTSLNRSSTKRVIRQLLPTDESPTSTSLNVKSLRNANSDDY